ncbi:MAG: adenylate kinase [Candidatus Yanofskybacteria bacterium]|nr:adenylate kinase [Candidatus Yanofskybacteria bacterium]
MLVNNIKRALVLGRGGAGKSTFSRELGKVLDIPVIELDKYFWKPDLSPLNNEEWIQLQKKLAKKERWIMDGDLGKYDVLSERIKDADTIIILSFPLWICLKRALGRSNERFDFWWWLITWKINELPKIKNTINRYAVNAKIVLLKNQRDADNFLSELP